MGNYKFRLSDMVPNSWFYKLKDMTKNKKQRQNTKKKPKSSSSLSSSNSSLFSSSSNLQQKTQTQQQQQPQNLLSQRKSYYISRNLNNHEEKTTTLSKTPTKLSEAPRKSSKKKKKTSSVGCNCSLESAWTKHDSISTSENYPNSPFSFSSSNFSSEQESSVHSPKTFDSMILSSSCQTCKNDHGFDSVSKIDLPPIITKPKKLEISTNGTKKTEDKTEEKQSVASPKRRMSVSSSNGVKLRTKSPRIVSRKSTNSRRRSSVGESFAVVKSSKDPQKDFKESMVEMIVENNIRKSKDLEELLACYLSLNSDQYHDLIIKVFKQIWFDITDIQLK